MGEDTDFNELLRKRAEELGDEDSGKRNRQQQNVCATQVTGELNRNLLSMCSGQLRALANDVNKLSTGIFLAGVIILGWIAWTQHNQSLFMDEMRMRIAALEAAQRNAIQEILQRVESAESHAERASKHVWDLKRALKLKFSQERSAEAAQDGED